MQRAPHDISLLERQSHESERLLNRAVSVKLRLCWKGGELSSLEPTPVALPESAATSMPIAESMDAAVDEPVLAEFGNVPAVPDVVAAVDIPSAAPPDIAATEAQDPLSPGAPSMARIHFIGGEKGGVGKSLVARLLAQYMIDRGLPFLGFDSDRSHGALMRFYADYASPVVIGDYESLDKVVEAATEDGQRQLIVDLAAQTHRPLVRWMEESGMLELARDFGIGVHYWHVMDSGRDSVDLLARLLDRFGAQLDYVLVLNQLRGEEFDILEASGQKARALALGAKIVTLPKLHDATMTRIDARSTSFWAAANEGVGLTLLERQRLRVWLGKAYAELERIAA